MMTVQGLFDISEQPGLIEKCQEFGIPMEDGQLILIREMDDRGRNICRANGLIITVAQLKTMGTNSSIFTASMNTNRRSNVSRIIASCWMPSAVKKASNIESRRPPMPVRSNGLRSWSPSWRPMNANWNGKRNPAVWNQWNRSRRPGCWRGWRTGSGKANSGKSRTSFFTHQPGLWITQRWKQRTDPDSWWSRSAGRKYCRNCQNRQQLYG